MVKNKCSCIPQGVLAVVLQPHSKPVLQSCFHLFIFVMRGVKITCYGKLAAVHHSHVSALLHQPRQPLHQVGDEDDVHDVGEVGRSAGEGYQLLAQRLSVGWVKSHLKKKRGGDSLDNKTQHRVPSFIADFVRIDTWVSSCRTRVSSLA